jgi:LysM repeat protein
VNVEPNFNYISRALTIQPGDTIDAIAKRYNTTVAHLVKLNGGATTAEIMKREVINVPVPYA